MNVVLAIAEDAGLCAALRATFSSGDLLLFEPDLHGAMRRLASLRVDVIVVDETGRGAAAQVAELKAAAPGTPVLVLTPRQDAASEAAYLRAGVGAIVPKPFQCERLLDEVAVLTAPAEPRPEEAAPDAPPHVPNTHGHAAALRWLSRVMAYEDAGRLAESLVEALSDVLDAARAAVLIETDQQVAISASNGLPDSITSNLRLQYGGGIMGWFDRHASLLDLAAAEREPAAAKEMRLLNARLAAPLLRDGQPAGALVVGERASGDAYTAEERELLSLLARGASLAFDHVWRQHQRAREQGYLLQVFDQMADGVVTMTPGRRVAALNASGARLLKRDAEELTGQSVQRLGSAFADVLLRTVEDKQPREQEVWDPAAGATLHVKAQPLPAGGVVANFARQEADRAPVSEVAHSPFWNYLSERVAQEIKNPMVAINTFAQLLPRKYDSEEFRDAFSRVVQSEVTRINKVVETLFAFARDPQLSLQRCALEETLEQVLKGFEAELAERQIKIERDFDPDVTEVEVDPAYFQQAVEQVVRNSVQAMPEGGRLSIRARREKGRVRVEIGDTGPGIPPQDAEQVFSPFFSTKEKGMGLGLPLARKIMEQHQGGLDLVAEEGSSGSRFTLYLPEHEDSYGNGVGH